MTTTNTWGGRRPNAGSGGPRPRTGPLTRGFTIAPFSHTERGETISEAEIVVERCNYCNAWGWRYLQAETLYDHAAAEDERLRSLSGVVEHSMVHNECCIHAAD